MRSLAVPALAFSLLYLAVACGESNRSNTSGPAAGTNGGGRAGQGGGTATNEAGDTGSPGAGSGGATTAGSGSGGSAGSGEAGAGGAECVPEVTPPEDCPDAIEGDVIGSFGYVLEVEADTELVEISGISGAKALRVDTQAGFLVTLRYTAPEALDALAADEFRLLVRGSNTNTGWQGNVPAVTFEDGGGARRTYTPPTSLISSDGATWVDVRVPLDGGAGYDVTGDDVDWSAIAAIELTADTWEAGFVLDVDGFGFVSQGAVCAVSCPSDCSGRGRCDAASLGCVCEVGADGEDCATCRSGFALAGA